MAAEMQLSLQADACDVQVCNPKRLMTQSDAISLT